MAKYPDHPTETKPIPAEHAKELLAIIDAGGTITNLAHRETCIRVAVRIRKARRKAQLRGELECEEG